MPPLRVRVHDIKRWNAEDTALFLETVRRHCDRLEKPTAQMFYNRLIEEVPRLKIYNWTGMRDKLRNLRQKFKNTKEWYTNARTSLQEENEETIREYMLKLCPQLDILEEIFAAKDKLAAPYVSESMSRDHSIKQEYCNDEFIASDCVDTLIIDVDKSVADVEKDSVDISQDFKYSSYNLNSSSEVPKSSNNMSFLNFKSEVQQFRPRYSAEHFELEKQMLEEELALKKEQLAIEKERHSSKVLPALPKCCHPKKEKSLQCRMLNFQDVRHFHQAFYATSNKIEQDKFILKYISQSPPKRHRKRSNAENSTNKERKNSVSIQYFVGTQLKGRLKVCSKTFLEILGISKYRVQNISKKYLIDGITPKERRGGDKTSKKYAAKREAVNKYLQSLQFVDSYYSRDKSKRYYLPSDCTAKKLWNEFNRSVTSNLNVKYCFFINIFNSDFNISFKTPATDACSECIRLKLLIPCLSGHEKQETIAHYRVHRMKARTFYDMLKKVENPTILKLSFGCQKNLVLPRVPDQAAYYSRQIYLYNLTICEGEPTSLQNTDSVCMYTWTENIRPKGSNEIASILYYHLINKDLSEIKEIKLFCDGCPGQNRNITVIGMLAKFLVETAATCKKITIVFPVVGHSFIPPDRVFGRIEKKIKKIDTIVNPYEYLDLFAECGNVRKVGEEVPIHDWKSAVAHVIKSPSQLHFKFSASKRIILEKKSEGLVTVQGEVHYKSDLGASKSILKQGMFISQIIPQPLPNTIRVQPEKLKDVNILLKKHFCENWRQRDFLKFYVNILDNNPDDITEESDDDEFIEELNQLRV